MSLRIRELITAKGSFGNRDSRNMSGNLGCVLHNENAVGRNIT